METTTKPKYINKRQTGLTNQQQIHCLGALVLGSSLSKWCKQKGVALTRVYEQLSKDKRFTVSYARARELQAATYIDQAVDIADDKSRDTYIDAKGKERTDNEVVNRSRLRVDTRLRIASKLDPRKWGERQLVDLNVTGKLSMVDYVTKQLAKPVGTLTIEE